VRVVAGFAPGGATDIAARLIGQSLSGRLGQQFVIENRPGAASNIATEAVVNAAPDGYTLLVATLVNAINATLYDKLKFDFLRDIAPIAGIHREALIVEINPSVPVKTVPELIMYAKANAGKVNMATAGVGSANHFAGELFKMMTNVNLLHVPYRGSGPALVDLIGGQVQLMFASMSSSIEYVRAGTVRALAVTTAMRSELLPDVPTVSEFVPGYEASYRTGIAAPKSTPVEIANRLNKEINAALADLKMKIRLADLGGVPISMSPAEFGEFIADEIEKAARIVRFAGMRAE
jgi:tripartite-type tricarboxylate transporter receptor subunit TctC